MKLTIAVVFYLLISKIENPNLFHMVVVVVYLLSSFGLGNEIII